MPTVVLKLHPSQPFELDADCSKLLPASHRVLWVGQFQQCVAGPGHLIGKFMTPLSARDITTRETIFLAIPVDISIRVPSRQTQPSEGVMLLESALPSRCSAPKAPKHVCSPSCLRHGDVKLPRFHFLIGHGMVRVELPAQIPLRACPTTHKQTAWSAAGGCNSSLQDNMPGRENNRKAPAIRRPSLPDGEFTVPSHTEVWFFVPDHIEEFREDWERKWMYASKQTLASASSSPVMPSQAGGGASSRREGVNSLLPSGLPLPDSEIPRVYLLHQRAVMASARLYDGRWSRHIRQVIQKVVEINRTRHHVLGDEQAPSTPRSVSDAECAFIEKEFERMAKEDTESSSVRWRNFQFQRFVSGETLPDHRLGPMHKMELSFDPRQAHAVSSDHQASDIKYFPDPAVPASSVRDIPATMPWTFETVGVPGKWARLSACIARYEALVHRPTPDQPNIFVWQACRETVFPRDAIGRFELDPATDVVAEKFIHKHSIHGKFAAEDTRTQLKKEVNALTREVDVSRMASRLERSLLKSRSR